MSLTRHIEAFHILGSIEHSSFKYNVYTVASKEHLFYFDTHFIHDIHL